MPVDEAIVQATQEAFSNLIKKPKMSEKLLNKPPFRFLHDVFSEVCKATGYAEGLYEGPECEAGSIKDKESKIAYLQKMLDYTQAACGSPIDVKLGKVVAGLEPENTNAFLQAMASSAANPSVDRENALRVALGLPAGDDGGADAAAEEEAARAAAEAAAEQARHQEEQQRALMQQQQQEEEARILQQQQLEQDAAENNQGGEPDVDEQAQHELLQQQMMQQQQEEEERARLQYEQEQVERARQEQEEVLRQQAEAQAQAPPPAAASNNSRPPSNQGHSRPPSHQGQQEYPDQGMGEPSNEMIPPQMRKALPARPTTARRAPPKLPTKEVKVNRGPTPVQEKPGEAPASIAVGLITEGDSEEEEEEDAAAMLSAPIPGWDDKTEDVDVDEDGQHGKLVGDILAEKKKMQSEQGQDGAVEEAAEEENQGIVIKKRRSSVESSVKRGGAAPPPVKKGSSDNSVHQLRDEIQKLVKATNPLGKCIEYIQEDLENMEKEYRMWKSDASSYAIKLDAKANNTESSLVPLQQELIEHTEKCENLTSQINRVKASILHNDMTIHNLLRGVVGTGMK